MRGEEVAWVGVGEESPPRVARRSMPPMSLVAVGRGRQQQHLSRCRGLPSPPSSALPRPITPIDRRKGSRGAGGEER